MYITKFVRHCPTNHSCPPHYILRACLHVQCIYQTIVRHCLSIHSCPPHYMLRACLHVQCIYQTIKSDFICTERERERAPWNSITLFRIVSGMTRHSSRHIVLPGMTKHYTFFGQGPTLYTRSCMIRLYMTRHYTFVRQCPTLYKVMHDPLIYILRACIRACVRECVRACVRLCVLRACVITCSA